MKLVVLGAGESGVGAAILGKKQGYQVLVSDKGEIKQKYKDVLLLNDIRFEENTHTLDEIMQADVVVKSPGIPDSVALIKNLKAQNTPVISEIEFGARFTSAKLIGITGSNGKTTTTSLVYHILKSCGLNVGLAGNIGQSFAWQVAEKSFDYYVLELSSFQLDGSDQMRLDIALLLNITPDHLDRYEYNFDKYIDSKFQIIKNGDQNTIFIANGDDMNIVKKWEKIDSKVAFYPFTIKGFTNKGARLENGNIFVDINNSLKISEATLPLKGKHNTYNIMAAMCVASALGLEETVVVTAVKSFQAIEHRLEIVEVLNGIEYINDSKATNVDSTWYALECMGNNVIWIAGGVDKGNDYSSLTELVKSKVHGIVCLGKENQKLHDAFGTLVKQIEDAASAEEAVRKATLMASEGAQVLLSPACASFDLFDNYEDRGKKFKRAISKLNE